MGNALSSAGACNVVADKGDFGVSGARRLVPASPALSLLSLRSHTRGIGRMPPAGPTTIDPGGNAVVDAWIGSVASCP